MRCRFRTSGLLSLVLLVAATLVGCVSPLPVGSAEEREELAAMRYPEDAPVDDPLHVDVERTGETVRFINREPRAFRDLTLWINQEYAGRVERLDIGPGNTTSLRRFVNRYGERFPVGRFLAPDETVALVSVEWVTRDADGNDVRRPLTVWPDKRWFED